MGGSRNLGVMNPGASVAVRPPVSVKIKSSSCGRCAGVLAVPGFHPSFFAVITGWRTDLRQDLLFARNGDGRFVIRRAIGGINQIEIAAVRGGFQRNDVAALAFYNPGMGQVQTFGELRPFRR